MKPAGISRIGKGALAGVAVSDRIRKVVRLRRREMWKESGMDASFTSSGADCMDSKGGFEGLGVVDDSKLEGGARHLSKPEKAKEDGGETVISPLIHVEEVGTSNGFTALRTGRGRGSATSRQGRTADEECGGQKVGGSSWT